MASGASDRKRQAEGEIVDYHFHFQSFWHVSCPRMADACCVHVKVRFSKTSVSNTIDSR